MYSFFTYKEILGIVVVFLFCYMSVLFTFDIIENSNLGSSVIEIIIAGTATYFLAKYFFRKEMNMKQREIDVDKKKIENDFQYYLRSAHVTSLMLVASKQEITELELKKLETWSHRAIESHKIFKPTNMEIRDILENCDKFIRKWTDGKMNLSDPLLLADLKMITVNLSRVGHKYNFDLSIA